MDDQYGFDPDCDECQRLKEAAAAEELRGVHDAADHYVEQLGAHIEREHYG